jgi:uncharacterized repeat protein (TIGR01451 family)
MSERGHLSRLLLLPLCWAFSVHAQIAVLKVASETPVHAGDVVGYSIVVHNFSVSTNASGTITDTLPAGPVWTAPAGCSYNAMSRLLQCSFTAAKNSNSATVTVTGTTTASDCGTLQNIASATSNVGSASSSNVVIVVRCPALKLIKVPDAAVVASGKPVGYSYALENDGLGTARSVTLDDQQPAGLWSVVPPVAGCSIGLSGHLVCAFGDVPFGDGRGVHITTSTTSSVFGTFSSEATADATNAPASATSTASVTVTKPGDEDGSGAVNVLDVFHLINFLFANGPPPK